MSTSVAYERYGYLTKVMSKWKQEPPKGDDAVRAIVQGQLSGEERALLMAFPADTTASMEDFYYGRLILEVPSNFGTFDEFDAFIKQTCDFTPEQSTKAKARRCAEVLLRPYDVSITESAAFKLLGKNRRREYKQPSSFLAPGKGFWRALAEVLDQSETVKAKTNTKKAMSEKEAALFFKLAEKSASCLESDVVPPQHDAFVPLGILRMATQAGFRNLCSKHNGNISGYTNVLAGITNPHTIDEEAADSDGLPIYSVHSFETRIWHGFDVLHIDNALSSQYRSNLIDSVDKYLAFMKVLKGENVSYYRIGSATTVPVDMLIGGKLYKAQLVSNIEKELIKIFNKLDLEIDQNIPAPYKTEMCGKIGRTQPVNVTHMTVNVLQAACYHTHNDCDRRNSSELNEEPIIFDFTAGKTAALPDQNTYRTHILSLSNLELGHGAKTRFKDRVTDKVFGSITTGHNTHYMIGPGGNSPHVVHDVVKNLLKGLCIGGKFWRLMVTGRTFIDPGLNPELARKRTQLALHGAGDSWEPPTSIGVYDQRSVISNVTNYAAKPNFMTAASTTDTVDLSTPESLNQAFDSINQEMHDHQAPSNQGNSSPPMALPVPQPEPAELSVQVNPSISESPSKYGIPGIIKLDSKGYKDTYRQLPPEEYKQIPIERGGTMYDTGTPLMGHVQHYELARKLVLEKNVLPYVWEKDALQATAVFMQANMDGEMRLLYPGDKVKAVNVLADMGVSHSNRSHEPYSGAKGSEAGVAFSQPYKNKHQSFLKSIKLAHDIGKMLRGESTTVNEESVLPVLGAAGSGGASGKVGMVAPDLNKNHSNEGSVRIYDHQDPNQGFNKFFIALTPCQSVVAVFVNEKIMFDKDYDPEIASESEISESDELLFLGYYHFLELTNREDTWDQIMEDFPFLPEKAKKWVAFRLNMHFMFYFKSVFSVSDWQTIFERQQDPRKRFRKMIVHHSTGPIGYLLDDMDDEAALRDPKKVKRMLQKAFLDNEDYVPYIKDDLTFDSLANKLAAITPDEAKELDGDALAEENDIKLPSDDRMKSSVEELVTACCFAQVAVAKRVLHQGLKKETPTPTATKKRRRGKLPTQPKRDDPVAKPLTEPLLGAVLQLHSTMCASRDLDPISLYMRTNAARIGVLPKQHFGKRATIDFDDSVQKEKLYDLATMATILRVTGRVPRFELFGEIIQGSENLNTEMPIARKNLEAILEFVEATLKGKQGKKRTTRLSQLLAANHAGQIPDLIKVLEGFESFVLGIRDRIEPCMMLCMQGTSYADAKRAVVEMLAQSIPGANQLDLGFLANHILADLYEVYEEPFGEMTIDDISEAFGSKEFTKVLRNSGAATDARDAYQKIFDYVVKEADEGILRMLGMYRRASKERPLHISNNRPFSWHDVENLTCKGYFIAANTLGHRTQSVQPLASKPHHHPVRFPSGRPPWDEDILNTEVHEPVIKAWRERAVHWDEKQRPGGLVFDPDYHMFMPDFGLLPVEEQAKKRALEKDGTNENSQEDHVDEAANEAIDHASLAASDGDTLDLVDSDHPDCPIRNRQGNDESASGQEAKRRRTGFWSKIWGSRT